MSWLSEATGIHISPKGAHLSTPNPLGAIKDAVSNPLFDAALGLALPGVGSAITGALGAIPGIGGALATGAGAVGSALGAIPGASNVAGAVEGATDAIPGGSALGGLLKTGAEKAGGFLTGNGGRNALGVAQGITTALQQKKANDLANRALQSSENAYAEKAPLRAMGLAGLMRPDVGNPYARAQ